MTLEARGRAPVLAFLFAGILLGTRCASLERRETEAPSSGSFAEYGGTTLQGTERGARFRVLLSAELPDRIHAEVLPPVGGPRLILDGGHGRISVALVAERLAYVGDAGEDSLARVLGARLSLPELVRALLGTELTEKPGCTIRREPRTGAPGLPQSFEIRSGDRGIAIERRGRERARATSASLGTGATPPGFSVLPLDELQIGEEASILERETAR